MTRTLQGETMFPGPDLSIDIRDTFPPPEDAIAAICNYNPSLDQEWLRGTLRPFTPRARRALEALLMGCTEREASIRAGTSTATILRWKHESPDFMDAVAVCREVGTALYEAELNRRALAGKDDPGSANLLKLKLQSVDEAYRDRRTLEVNNFNIHSSEAVGPILGAWQARRVIEGKATDVVEHPNPSLTDGDSAPAESGDSTPPQGTGGG